MISNFSIATDFGVVFLGLGFLVNVILGLPGEISTWEAAKYLEGKEKNRFSTDWKFHKYELMRDRNIPLDLREQFLNSSLHRLISLPFFCIGVALLKFFILFIPIFIYFLFAFPALRRDLAALQSEKADIAKRRSTE
jgi:hypothetical protein